MDTIKKLEEHYERFPYPKMPVFPLVRRKNLDSLSYEKACIRCGISPKEKPRILVAGSGTVEAVAVAKANPKAGVLALDLSSRSLKILRRAALINFVSRRITTRQGDLLKDLKGEMPFDFIVCSGVLHHLPEPEDGLKALAGVLAPSGVMRLMLYSRHGRELLYETKALCEALRIRTPAELRKFLAILPSDHSFRLFFHLYEDAENLPGLMDGYFHVQDQAFSAEEIPGFLKSAGLVFSGWLKEPGSFSPEVDALHPVARMALLDRLNQHDSNYRFFAMKEGS